jgi:hypothetical protein
MRVLSVVASREGRLPVPRRWKLTRGIVSTGSTGEALRDCTHLVRALGRNSVGAGLPARISRRVSGSRAVGQGGRGMEFHGGEGVLPVPLCKALCRYEE